MTLVPWSCDTCMELVVYGPSYESPVELKCPSCAGHPEPTCERHPGEHEERMCWDFCPGHYEPIGV